MHVLVHALDGALVQIGTESDKSFVQFDSVFGLFFR
jgi:hypothetical protein